MAVTWAYVDKSIREAYRFFNIYLMYRKLFTALFHSFTQKGSPFRCPLSVA